MGAYAHNKNGATNAGHVRIYQYTPSGTSSWTLYGDIEGHGASDYSGTSVSLSADGTRLAIGAYLNNGANGTNSGHVRIFDNTSGSSWGQVGSDIDGDSANDRSGSSVSLSSDGSRVAIGAEQNNGRGYVSIYELQSGTWTKLGNNIAGEGATDKNGSSVSLNSDGSIVAIGASDNAGGGTVRGHVRIYKYINNSWTQLGADIDGENNNDFSGSSVSLSSDGSRVAIGAPNNDGTGADAGHVRIYDYDGSSWVKVGVDIDGEATGDQSGYYVSLTSDGSKIAIGAPYNKDRFGRFTGHTRIYSLPVGDTYQYAWDVDSGGAPSDGTYRATVAGADLAGNAYSGTDSITFTVDSTAPTVTLTDTDADNIISTTLSPTNTVTITASFSKPMTATPSIYITGVVTNVAMTRVGSTNSYTYNWNTSTPTLAAGAYSVTVSGTDSIGNAYAGTDSITFTISPTFYLDANGVTVKCRGCNAGDQGVVNGVIYTAHDNTTLAAKNKNDNDWDRIVTTLVTDMSDLI